MNVHGVLKKQEKEMEKVSHMFPILISSKEKYLCSQKTEFSPVVLPCPALYINWDIYVFLSGLTAKNTNTEKIREGVIENLFKKSIDFMIHFQYLSDFVGQIMINLIQPSHSNTFSL